MPGDCAGQVLVAGAGATPETLAAAAEQGASAVVVGSIEDATLREFLGFDLGVAVTGHEEVPLTLIITEGFGQLDMATRTFEVLGELDGMAASVNGATQIRAGAVRPEIIVPNQAGDREDDPAPGHRLEIGSRVRIIRVPNFGALAEVTELPQQPAVIESGATVRVLKARLDSGENVTVPRANVELV